MADLENQESQSPGEKPGRQDNVMIGAETSRPAATADAVRRKLLKTGAMGVPVAVSLQSGTAWAISTCALRATRPTETAVDTALGDPQNRATITGVTGITDAQITTIVSEASALAPGAPFPEVGGTVHSGEVLWLMVNNTTGGSCWTSYCEGSILTGDVNVTGTASNSVCN